MRKKLLVLIAILEFPALLATAQNYALSLNGSTDYVTIGTPLSSNGSYTKEAWVYQTSSTGSQNIISSLNTPLWINGGTLSAGQAGSPSLVTAPTAIPVNTWVYVAVTYDATSTTMNLYMNGTLVATNNSVPAYTAESTYIGSLQGTGSFFQGYIDEVRIWTVALTQAQLKPLLFSGPVDNATGLVAYYTCNDGSGTTLTSSCTNTTGANGTLEGSATWVASPIQFGGNALNFNGSSSSVMTIPDNSSLDISSAITLEAWVYATSNSGTQDVVSKSSNTQNSGYIFPRTDDGWAHTVFYLYVGGWQTLSAVYPSLNAWHHLAATYDGATMKVYIDGVLSASQALTGTIFTNTNALALGVQPGYYEYFTGSVDEVRVWNLARTQAQIQAAMNMELNPATQTGLAAYYTFDQGIAGGTNTGLTTVIDQSGNNNGTLTNFTLSGATNNFVTQNPGIILPVTLISFTAQKMTSSVLLQWSTATEENSKDFVIQRNTDNGWNNIGAVAAAGNSNTVRNYSFVDNQPVNGANNYRLLQTDAGGEETYSQILSVQFSTAVAFMILYNNPVIDGVLQVSLSKPCNLLLYDTEGRLLWQKQAPTGVELIDVSSFAKGVYFLKANGQAKEILIR
jgi:Concanavalin A-like lectin/glucanases superfamily